MKLFLSVHELLTHQIYEEVCVFGYLLDVLFCSGALGLALCGSWAVQSLLFHKAYNTDVPYYAPMSLNWSSFDGLSPLSPLPRPLKNDLAAKSIQVG